MEISFEKMSELYSGYHFNIPTSYICSRLLGSRSPISSLFWHIRSRCVHKILES